MTAGRIPLQPIASTSRLTLGDLQTRVALLPPLVRASSSTAPGSSTTPTPTPTTTSTNTSPRSSSRRISRRLSPRPGATLVGPIDPISNLRPVIYGSAFETINDPTNPTNITTPSSSSSSTDPSRGTTGLSSHPYSTSEFTSLPSTSSATLKHTHPRSHYQTALLRKLESAELAHHLRLARSDRFSQEFWEDNNRRFQRALDEYRMVSSSSSTFLKKKAREDGEKGDGEGEEVTASRSAHSEEEEEAGSSGRRTTRRSKEEEDLLSPFYTAWLRANAERHRAYNDRLWSMTREDLVPAVHYALLRSWVAVVVKVEERMNAFLAKVVGRTTRGKSKFTS